ncbi:hypothetical protein ACET3Z_030498 [Daucus carota]
MAFGFASYNFLICALLVLQCGYGISARMTIERRMYLEEEIDDDLINITNPKPSYNVWFTPKDLYKGFTKPVYFEKEDPAKMPYFLSKEEADAIPFAIPELDNILARFSISRNSPQGKAIAYTIYNCDLHPTSHMIASCVSSLESMLDLVQKSYGPNTNFDLYTSVIHHSENTPLLQNYTFLDTPYQIPTQKMIACHPMPYPYAIFYCHGHLDGSTKVYKIPLGGEYGDRVEAIAVCHADTSGWDKDHISFKMLHMKPGSGPVCHVIPQNNFVWIPTNSVH